MTDHVKHKIKKIKQLMTILDGYGVDYSHLTERYYQSLGSLRYDKLLPIIIRLQELVDLNQ